MEEFPLKELDSPTVNRHKRGHQEAETGLSPRTVFFSGPLCKLNLDSKKTESCMWICHCWDKRVQFLAQGDTLAGSWQAAPTSLLWQNGPEPVGYGDSHIYLPCCDFIS